MTTTNFTDADAIEELANDLEAQAMVTLDALEAKDGRSGELLAPILALVSAHGEREGWLDYEGRASDVEAGQQAEDWAWPFAGADEAYLSAVGTSEIVREIGIPEDLWEHVASAWFEAFERGYRSARNRG